LNMSTAATASKNAAPTWDEEVDFPNEALASETESDSASDGEAARWSRGVPTGPAGAAIDNDRPGSSRGSDDSAMMTKGAEGADTAVHDGEVRRVCIEGEGKMRFVPPTLEIRAGDVVRWEQDKRCPVNHFLEVVAIVDDAEVQVAESSDVLTPATPWHHRFDTPGEYHYRSLVHTYMKGTVRVAPRILGSLKSDPSDPYEFVDEVGETDLSWLERSRIKDDHASSSSDEGETRDHAVNEYSLLPSGDEEEDAGAEAAGMGRGTAPASVSAPNKLPTKEESDAMIDQLLRLGKSAKDGGSNADALKSMDAAFGSLDLLSSGKAMPMLNEMRKKRMTMGSSDRGDAGIWQRHKKESSPTFKQLIKPPPDAVRATLEQIHDEERKAATDKVKARMRAMGRSDGVGPASSLMSETLSDTDFPPEFGLEKLLRDGETFFCKHCGKPFASTMNMTRHAMCGDCPQKNGDSKKKKKKDPRNKSAPPATREQLAGFLVEMTGHDRVDFLKSVGTDEHGQEWQTKQLLLRAMKNRHDDHFLVMLHPERIYKPGDGKERQLRRVASAVSSHLGLAKNKAEGLASVFDRYTSHGAFLRDMIETPEEMRDADIMQWQGVLEALKVASEETFLQSGKYGGVVDNPDTMCRGVNQEAALAYMTEVALVDAYVAARSAEAEAEQRKLLAELDEAAADDERRERRRLKEKAKKAKAKAKKKGLDTSSPPGSEPSNAEKEKESEADFEKDASDEDDDDEEAERERERLEAEVEAARLAKRRAAEEAEALAELAEREARELAAAERRMEMEYVAREKARVAAEEEKARRKSGEFSVVGGGGGIAGGGLLGVMANGVVASPYGKAKPKKTTPAPQKQPQGSPPERSPNKPPAHPAPSTDGDAGKQKRERFVPPLPPGPPPAAARSPDGAGKAAASGAGSTQAPVAKGSGSTQAPVVKPRPAAFDPSKQPTRSAPAPVVSAASVAPPSAHKAVHRQQAGGGKGPGSSYRSGGNTSATSMSESDYRSSDAEGGPGGVKMSRKARAAAKAAAKAEAARSGRESGNSSQSEHHRTSGGNIEVYKSEPKERLSSTETEKPERYSKPLSEVEGMLLAAAERTETQARRARAAAEEAEASLRAKEAARMAAEEAERRAEEAEAKKADERKVATVAATAPRVKFCTQCGERQTEGARFCSGCGVAVAKPADAPAAAASPTSHHPGATQAPGRTGHHPGHYPGGHPPYGSQTAPPPPFVGGYPVGAPTPPGVPPGDYGPEYNALYMQHYHAALATITAQQQQYMGFAPSDPTFAQGGYPPLQQGPMQGAYPPPGAYGVPGATAGHGAPPPPKPKGPPPGPKGPKHSKKGAKGADSSG